MLFGQKRMYPKNNSGRECCWPYLIGQHPLSPVFGQKRPGTSGNSYFAQLPPVFGHFMFLSGGLLDCSNRSTWFFFKQLTAKFRPGDVEIDNIFSFFCINNFSVSPSYTPPSLLHQPEPQPTSKISTERCIDCRRSRQLMKEQRAKNKPYSQMSPPKHFDCSIG